LKLYQRPQPFATVSHTRKHKSKIPMRSTQEYAQRKRFPVQINQSFERFAERLWLEDNTIFEVLTMPNTLIRLKITASYGDLLFDLKECTPSGEQVYRGYRRGSVEKTQIAARLYEGDWRILSYPTSTGAG